LTPPEPAQVDGFFLRRCKQGTLQFVLLKPVMAALTLILYAGGAYTDGEMSPRDGYFYISILYNLCYTFALYGLMLFWIGAAELLEPFNPLLKFVLVKTVVFLTFWQVRGRKRGGRKASAPLLPTRDPQTLRQPPFDRP
jgi:hypothetical protein